MLPLPAVTEPPFVNTGDFTMIATANTSSLLFPHIPLYPSPLHIHRKLRKTILSRRILRKSTHSTVSNPYEFGPLDDIIDEIKSDI